MWERGGKRDTLWVKAKESFCEWVRVWERERERGREREIEKQETWYKREETLTV